MAFGVVDLNVPSLMCESSILMPRPTDILVATESMSWKRSVMEYEQRVREIEHASFTPLVLSATGGMANEAAVFYKRLASCLATKWDRPYSSTMSWLRCRLTFSLLRSAIQCIRGARSNCGHAAKSQTPPLDLVIAELDFI
jgi:hypothetical protein